MNEIKSIVHIISTDGGDFDYFTDKEDLYTKLSGIKDTEGNNMEFIEIDNIITLNNQKLRVLNINIKLANIDNNTKHLDKKQSNFPKEFFVETIITVDSEE